MLLNLQQNYIAQSTYQKKTATFSKNT